MKGICEAAMHCDLLQGVSFKIPMLKNKYYGFILILICQMVYIFISNFVKKKFLDEMLKITTSKRQ